MKSKKVFLVYESNFLELIIKVTAYNISIANPSYLLQLKKKILISTHISILRIYLCLALFYRIICF